MTVLRPYRSESRAAGIDVITMARPMITLVIGIQIPFSLSVSSSERDR